MYDLGYKIKLLRVRRGISQRDLARRINKSTSAVSSYETNAQMPPLDVLISICEVLHTSLDYLVLAVLQMLTMYFFEPLEVY